MSVRSIRLPSRNTSRVSSIELEIEKVQPGESVAATPARRRITLIRAIGSSTEKAWSCSRRRRWSGRGSCPRWLSRAVREGSGCRHSALTRRLATRVEARASSHPSTIRSGAEAGNLVEGFVSVPGGRHLEVVVTETIGITSAMFGSSSTTGARAVACSVLDHACIISPLPVVS